MIVFVVFLGMMCSIVAIYFPVINRIDQSAYINMPIVLKGQVQDVGKRSLTVKVNEVLSNHIADHASNINGMQSWLVSSGKALIYSTDDTINMRSVTLQNSVLIHGRVKAMPYCNIPTDRNTGYYRTRKIVLVVDAHKLEIMKEHHVSMIARLREGFDKTLQKGRIESDALIKAIMVGDRSELTQSEILPFFYSNTVHILSISGLHIGLIAAMILFVLRAFGCSSRMAAGLTILLIWCYALLSGFRLPVVRACIMGSLLLLSNIINRRVDVYNSLGLAALILLAVNPFYISDAGFQLSFMSVLALFLFMPIIEQSLFVKNDAFLQIKMRIEKEKIWFHRTKQFLRTLGQSCIKLFCASLSVWIAIVPIIIIHYS
ncbi:MAG: ComEC/Rec2 family competence protein, partial [Chlamydiota bacterium]|nr:ComEC/Rec2 family competence protein [Chlamydiota bacterium]